VTDLQTAVDQLHAVPLEDFVAERKRLAKELRSGGDRDAAAELAKLPKPSAPAWALNHVAREEPAAVADWLEATGALRDASAHADRSSGDALRAAMAAHRDATRQLLATVRDRARPNGRPLTEPMLDRVRDLLQAATADEARAELLRAGRAVEGDEDAAQPDGDAEDGAGRDGTEIGRSAKDRTETGRSSKDRTETGRSSKDRSSKDRSSKDRTETRRSSMSRSSKDRTETRRSSMSRSSKDRAADDRAADDDRAAADVRAAKEREAREAAEHAELERLVADVEARVSDLRDAAEERAAAVASAEERLEEAQRALHRSESEVAAAREAAEEAADAAEHAERELRTLTAKLSS
jgi:hypothetical protein